MNKVTNLTALLDAPARPDTTKPCPCCGCLAWRQRPGPASWPMICGTCYPDPRGPMQTICKIQPGSPPNRKPAEPGQRQMKDMTYSR